MQRLGADLMPTRHGPVGPHRMPHLRQQPPAGSGVGRLLIEAKCSRLVWMQRLLGRPEIVIDGGPVSARWGVNTYDLREGEHELQATTDYLFSYVATTYATVSIHAGHQTYLYYKAPVLVRRAGALDARPKGYPGMSVLVAAYISALTVLVALIALFLYLHASG